MSSAKPLLTAILHRPVDNYGAPSTSRSRNDRLHLPKTQQKRLADLDRRLAKIHVPDISRSVVGAPLSYCTQSLRNSTRPENRQGKSKAVGRKVASIQRGSKRSRALHLHPRDRHQSHVRGRDRGNRQGGERVEVLGSTNK